MRIAMIGTGYVGLVTGACFSEFGVEVVCVDKDAAKIDMLHRGEIPIFEPGLDSLVASNVAAERLTFTTDLQTAVADADARPPSPGPTRSSSPSARPAGAVTGTRISATYTRPPRKSPPASPAIPSW